MTATITIPFDPNRASLNRRLHWRARKRINDVAKAAASAAYILAGRPRFETPIVVDVLVRRSRVLDDDNALSGLKSARDQLVRCGLAPDDSRKWWKWGEVEFETGKQWKGREEVVLTVKERQDA